MREDLFVEKALKGEFGRKYLHLSLEMKPCKHKVVLQWCVINRVHPRCT